MASSLFGGVQKPNPLRSAMQAVNMMRNANPEQIVSEHGIDINAIKQMFG